MLFVYKILEFLINLLCNIENRNFIEIISAISTLEMKDILTI